MENVLIRQTAICATSRRRNLCRDCETIYWLHILTKCTTVQTSFLQDICLWGSEHVVFQVMGTTNRGMIKKVRPKKLYNLIWAPFNAESTVISYSVKITTEYTKFHEKLVQKLLVWNTHGHIDIVSLPFPTMLVNLKVNLKVSRIQSVHQTMNQLTPQNSECPTHQNCVVVHTVHLQPLHLVQIVHLGLSRCQPPATQHTFIHKLFNLLVAHFSSGACERTGKKVLDSLKIKYPSRFKSGPFKIKHKCSIHLFLSFLNFRMYKTP